MASHVRSTVKKDIRCVEERQTDALQSYFTHMRNIGSHVDLAWVIAEIMSRGRGKRVEMDESKWPALREAESLGLIVEMDEGEWLIDTFALGRWVDKARQLSLRSAQIISQFNFGDQEEYRFTY